ncbi:MAG: DUF2096 family protein [Candidatus Bathyarchaeia archaeon]
MGYLAVWKVLDEMVVDFRKRGISVPAYIIADLRYAKTLINVLKADPNYAETSQKIEEYLHEVESHLISEGQKLFGVGYMEEWLKKLDEAISKPFEEEKTMRFVPGVPREHRWIRVKPSAILSIKSLEALAKESNLSCKIQEDGYMLVYGEDENIKDFVKKMAIKHGLKVEK